MVNVDGQVPKEMMVDHSHPVAETVFTRKHNPSHDLLSRFSHSDLDLSVLVHLS